MVFKSQKTENNLDGDTVKQLVGSGKKKQVSSGCSSVNIALAPLAFGKLISVGQLMPLYELFKSSVSVHKQNIHSSRSILPGLEYYTQKFGDGQGVSICLFVPYIFIITHVRTGASVTQNYYTV